MLCVGLANGSNLLHESFGQWLVQHLCFQEIRLFPTPEQSMSIWTALGLKSDFLGEVAAEWQ
eukprot:7074105-Lingulodinium_polyedra.AAC.1